jgi:hypothetical protein
VLAIILTAQRFSIDGDEGDVCLLINSVSPANKGSLELRRFDARYDHGDSVMHRYFNFKQPLTLEPRKMLSPKS